MPDSVLLPLCAVQNSTQASFLLRNVRYKAGVFQRERSGMQLAALSKSVWCFPFHSKLQTYFQWEGMAPFHLSPERGQLEPNQECYITVVFQPQEALVYQEHASCRFGEESENAQSSCTVLMQGVGMHSETVRNRTFQSWLILNDSVFNKTIIVKNCLLCFKPSKYNNLSFYFLVMWKHLKTFLWCRICRLNSNCVIHNNFFSAASYPYLQLRNLSGKDENPQCDVVLDFGSVAIGQSSQKFFHIFNPSPVSEHKHECR